MSVRSFHSVFMASVVAGAALGCYLVSLRVASERAALQQVETRIVLAQRDIRLIQTEIGTRARLAQLERWNVRVLALSAPSVDQILGDKFQLARLIAPQHKLPVDAPVVLASAPVGPPQLQPEAGAAVSPAGQLLHEAGLKLPEPAAAPAKPSVSPVKIAEPKPAPLKPEGAKAAAEKSSEATVAKAQKKAGDNTVKPATPAMTKPVRTARVDPLAPLAADRSSAKGSLTNR